MAGTIELGNEEVYYRLYADPLQLNYFDSSPMVGWLIRLSTFNLFFDNAIAIRSGAIFCSAISTWMMYKCGRRLVNEYTGFLAALLYTASIFGSIIAGTFMLPDAPLMVCWLASLYMLIKITETKYITKKSIKCILWFGVFTGIGMLCKIYMVFVWLGFILYILFYCRDWLMHWSIYAAASVTILLFTPVLLWNVQNDFFTFIYYYKKINFSNSSVNFESLLSFAGGQVFYCNPVVFFLIVRAVWHRDLFVKKTNKRMLLLAGVPLIFLATIFSLFKELQPYCTAPAFSSLILLTAGYYSRKHWVSKSKLLVPSGFSFATVVLVFIVAGCMALVFLFPGTLGSKNEQRKGDGDLTLDVYGWKDFSTSFDSIYHSTHPGSNVGKTIILANEWVPAAHIDFYVAQPLNIQTVVIGSIEKIHQYHWLNKQRGLPADSTDIYVISPSNYIVSKENIAALKNILPTHRDTIIQYRNEKEVRKFYVDHYRKDKYNFNLQKY